MKDLSSDDAILLLRRIYKDLEYGWWRSYEGTEGKRAYYCNFCDKSGLTSGKIDHLPRCTWVTMREIFG